MSLGSIARRDVSIHFQNNFMSQPHTAISTIIQILVKLTTFSASTVRIPKTNLYILILYTNSDPNTKIPKSNSIRTNNTKLCTIYYLLYSWSNFFQKNKC